MTVVLKRRGNVGTQGNIRGAHEPCEDIERRQPPARQEERPLKKPKLATP